MFYNLDNNKLKVYKIILIEPTTTSLIKLNTGNIKIKKIYNKNFDSNYQKQNTIHIPNIIHIIYILGEK